MMAIEERPTEVAELDTGLPLVVRFRPVIELSEEEFFEFCQLNGELRIERNAKGALLLMPPAGGSTSWRNADITAQLVNWAKRDGRGIPFDSSGGFRLPNSAMRAPDAAWILRSRWNQLPKNEQDVFAPICPDFVLELRSPSDTLRSLQLKMQEYLETGARLGWLIDPIGGRAYIYRPGKPVARLDRPDTISGDPELLGFVLDLREIW